MTAHTADDRIATAVAATEQAIELSVIGSLLNTAGDKLAQARSSGSRRMIGRLTDEVVGHVSDVVRRAESRSLLSDPRYAPLETLGASLATDAMTLAEGTYAASDPAEGEDKKMASVSASKIRAAERRLG